MWFMSTSLPDIEHLIAKSFMNIITEGPSNQYFEEAPLLPPVTEASNLGQEEAVNNHIIHQSGDLCEDITIAQVA